MSDGVEGHRALRKPCRPLNFPQEVNTHAGCTHRAGCKYPSAPTMRLNGLNLSFQFRLFTATLSERCGTFCFWPLYDFICRTAQEMMDRCSEDRASVHGTPAQFNQLNGARCGTFVHIIPKFQDSAAGQHVSWTYRKEFLWPKRLLFVLYVVHCTYIVSDQQVNCWR